MIDFSEALLRVQKLVNQPDYYWPNRPTVIVSEDYVIDKPWGWVFFHNIPGHEIGGNAPVLVERETGRLFYTGTVHSIEYYIDQYENGEFDHLPEDPVRYR